MPNPRFLCMYPKISGPYSRGGEDVFVFVDQKTGIRVAHQFNNGGDAYEISDKDGPIFKERPFPGKVITPGLHEAWSGNLRTATKLVGANHTAFPRPGYDWMNGLHTGLASQPDIPERRRMDESDRETGVCQTAYYEVDATNTSPLIYAHAGVLRLPSLGISPYGGTVYRVHDEITALATCKLAILNHPNPLLRSGDRIVLPRTLGVLRDRDGKAEIHEHPFVAASEHFLGQAVPERCFFAFIPPLNDGFVPILLLRQNGTAIGMRYFYQAKFPFIPIWYSPGGYCGLESGALPLGAEELTRLNMLPVFERGSGWTNIMELHFLDNPASVQAFMAANQMDGDVCGPVEILPSEKDHAALAEAATAYNTEHELT